MNKSSHPTFQGEPVSKFSHPIVLLPHSANDTQKGKQKESTHRCNRLMMGQRGNKDSYCHIGTRQQEQSQQPRQRPR